ncbi:MAG TPA: MFS transporter [Micromonosporaceae bacterium]|nr:MFS transporter [Micromonosporaceae bacterium]
MRARLGTTFASLQVRNYRLFATGQLVKLIGVWMLFIAQDWLVLQLTDDSATALGMVTALQFAPMLLFSLYGGQLADRYDKRRLLIIVNVLFALCTVALGLLVTLGSVELWQIFVSAAVSGTVGAIENPVRQSFVSELVGQELLPNALSLSGATFNSARIIGPAIAGVGIGWFGVGPVLIFDAVLCTAPLIALTRMRPAELYRTASGAAARGETRIIDGLRYVWERRDLRLPILLVFVIGMFGFNFQVTLAVLAKTTFSTGAQSFGLLTTALAVGALGGAMAGTGRRARPSSYLVITAAILFGVLEIVVAFAPTFAVAVLLLLPTGFFMVYFAQAANQRVQLGTDAAYRGRVMALYVLVFLGTTPVGAPVIGWLSQQYGPRTGIWIGGVITLVAALVAGAGELRRMGARVRLHLTPVPHVHVSEPAHNGSPAMELRVPKIRPAAH